MPNDNPYLDLLNDPKVGEQFTGEPATQQSDNEYLNILNSSEKDAQGSIFVGVQANPAKESEAVRIGSKLGVPPSVVGSDLEFHKQEEARVDWSNLLKVHPALQPMVGNPDLFSRIADDNKAIGSTADLLNTVGFRKASEQVRKEQDAMADFRAVTELVATTQLDRKQAQGLYDQLKVLVPDLRAKGAKDDEVWNAVSSTINKFGRGTITNPSTIDNLKQDHPYLMSGLSGLQSYASGGWGYISMFQEAADKALRPYGLNTDQIVNARDFATAS